MPDLDTLRGEHAAAVPVYVRNTGDAWALVESESGEDISTHATAREALSAALDRADVTRAVKRANLRVRGNPIGEWRWLDATAEEDEPIGEERITAASVWEMAAALNERKSAIPINGGGAPRAGLGDSVPHGDAGGSDHLANGFAHMGFPVIDEDGRTHLFLRGELMPEIAREFDLGRLAYGSIRFGYESADEDDNYGIKGAVLISHALTNDPAVTTLTAGSERRRGHEHAFEACRTRRTIMAKKTTQRGPAGDVLAKIADMLGVKLSDEMEGDGWYSPIVDAINALKTTAKVETIVEGGAPAETEAPAEESTEARASKVMAALREKQEAALAAARSIATALREVEGVEPEAVDPMLAQMLGLAREILGKPDASAEDVVAELEAAKAKLAAAMGEDAPDDADAGEMESDAEGDEDEPEEEDEKARAAAREAARDVARDPKAKRSDVRKAARKLACAVERYEAREWLDGEIGKRKLAVPAERRAKWLDMALAKGRDVVTEILDAQHRPPMGAHPLDEQDQRAERERPKSYAAAVDACMNDAREKLGPSKNGKPHPNHVVRAAAQRLVAERFPEFAEQSASN